MHDPRPSGDAPQRDPRGPRASAETGGLRRTFVRAAVKLLIFAAVVVIVLFPYPRQLIRHLGHLRNMDAMVAPDTAALDALEQELRERLAGASPDESSSNEAAAPEGDDPSRAAARGVQREIEQFVLEKVVYAWDWDLWGAADYFPTIEEIFEKASQSDGVLREDCDGRALVAASLMRRMGYDAKLATDLRHVWVVTPEGAWMGPGDATAVSSDASGNRVAWGTLLRNVPMSLSFGIAVFPFVREMIILLAAWALMLNRRTPARAAVVGLLLLVLGLLFMRQGFISPSAVSREASSWPAWVGLGYVATGLIALWRAGRREKGRFRQTAY